MAPKRQPSDYNRFMQEYIPKLKKDHPELTHKEAFKRVAEAWKFHPDNPKNQGK